MQPEQSRHENLDALKQAIYSVGLFNQAHSSGVQLGKAMFSVFASLLRGEDDDVVPRKPENSPVTLAQSIFDRHQSALNRIGLEIVLNQDRSDNLNLKFEFPERAAAEKSSPGVVIFAEVLSLGVLDPSRLLSFFESLNLSHVSSPAAAAAIADVAGEIDRSIVRAYYLELNGLEEGQHEALYDAAAEISSELQRLGLKAPASVLTYHLEHVWQGDLREQLIAEKGSILPGEGFRPHIWHIDNTTEMYRERWVQALDSLGMVLENPRASAVASEAIRYLTESLSIAADYYRGLERNDQAPDYRRALVPEYLEIVSDMRSRLEAMSPDAR